MLARSNRGNVGRCIDLQEQYSLRNDGRQTSHMKNTIAIQLARQVSYMLAWIVLSTGAGHATAQTSLATGLGTDANSALLLEKYATLEKQLGKNSFGRPLVLESLEEAASVTGNAYAVLDASFATVSTTFRGPTHWCEVMILHMNTKYCRAASDVTPTTLMINIGKKTPQEPEDAFALEFAMREVTATTRYLSVQLNAKTGPLGTNNYRIELEAAPLPSGKTFIHLRYAYGYSVAGRLAMQGYLATVGSGKVGFSHLNGDQNQGYVGGVRGTVERNTVRYYLAIEAYLVSLNRPPVEQLDARLAHWFDATEQFPQQLHEMDRDSYLSMKRAEYSRQLRTPRGPAS